MCVVKRALFTRKRINRGSFTRALLTHLRPVATATATQSQPAVCVLPKGLYSYIYASCVAKRVRTTHMSTASYPEFLTVSSTVLRYGQFRYTCIYVHVSINICIYLKFFDVDICMSLLTFKRHISRCSTSAECGRKTGNVSASRGCVMHGRYLAAQFISLDICVTYVAFLEEAIYIVRYGLHIYNGHLYCHRQTPFLDTDRYTYCQVCGLRGGD